MQYFFVLSSLFVLSPMAKAITYVTEKNCSGDPELWDIH